MDYMNLERFSGTPLDALEKVKKDIAKELMEQQEERIKFIIQECAKIASNTVEWNPHDGRPQSPVLGTNSARMILSLINKENENE